MKLHYPEGMKLHGDNACNYHGFEKYDWKSDRDERTMFWLYGEDDYKLLANHAGQKYVCWHNADVVSLANVFAGKFINVVRDPQIKHICLNRITQAELATMGIHARLEYIFWGNALKYQPQEKFTRDAYMCANKGRGIEYGESLFNALAWQFPDWTFHIFGIDPTIQVYCDNVKYYGWISEDEMDSITTHFALCIRRNVHDGFPQVMCKALLRGQGVITTIPYDGMTVVAKNYHELVMLFNDYGNSIVDGLDDLTTTPVRDMLSKFAFCNE